MIRRFHGNDTVADFRIMITKIFGKFRLRGGRTDDQDLARIADSVHHLRQELRVRRRVAAADGVGLVMKVPRRQMRVQHNLVGAREPDVEDPSLRMVDPDDRAKVGRHACVFVLSLTVWFRTSCCADLGMVLIQISSKKKWNDGDGGSVSFCFRAYPDLNRLTTSDGDWHSCIVCSDVPDASMSVQSTAPIL